MTHRRLRARLCCAAALTTALIPSLSSAQVDDEIIVTAQKRVQVISEVPISVAALDAEFIEAAGITDFDQAADFIPNLNFYQGFDRSEVAVNIRGLTSGTSNPGIDPSVGFFVDGVYIARPAALTGKLPDIDRMEVLRGPQGTLYGRNTSAGAVNVFTKSPTDETETSFLVGYGNHNAFDLQARISGPIGDQFGGSISGFYSEADSHLDDAVTGDPIGKSEDFGVRGKLVWEPADEIDFVLSVDYSESNANFSSVVGAFRKDQAAIGQIFQAIQMTGNRQLAGFIRAVENVPVDTFNRTTFRSDFEEADNLQQFGVSLQVDWDMPLGVVTSITAHRDSEDFASIDPDVSQAEFFRTSVRNEDRQFSQELRLASPTEDRFEYLLGAYIFDADFTVDTQTEFGIPLFGQFNAMMPPNPITTPQSANSITSQDTSALALFGQLSYDLTDALKLTYGFRYNDEEKSSVINQNPDRGINSASQIPFPLQFPIFTGLNAEVADEDFINLLSVNYRLGTGSNIYATYSEGLKSGGVNASILLNTQGLTFEKEASTNYEIGYRGNLGPARFSLAAFYTEFDNLQIQTFDPTNPANIIVTNAGAAEIMGVEGDLFVEITDGLTFNAAAAYNDSEYVETIFPRSAPGMNPALPGITLFLPANVDVSGETLSRAPEFSGSVGLQYEFAVSETFNAIVRGDYSYVSDQFLDSILSPESEIDGYGLLNLSGALRTSDDQWEFRVWGRNVLDEDYYSQLIASPGAAALGVDPMVATWLGTQGAPATYGVSISKRF